MAESKLKIGDKVWYFDSWDNLRHGEIYDISKAYALTKEGKFGGARAGAKLEDCYPTKEACLKAKEERVAKQKAEYKASIKSIEDLVCFLYHHDVQSEFRDRAADEAAVECAAEFGIDLGDGA